MDNIVKSGRNIGLDILRALAMFLVICQHILGQGGLLAHTAAGSARFYVLSFLQILVYCAVDVYGITTGYLMCRKQFRLSRLTKLWTTTVFWSVAVSCCFFALVPESRTLKEVISMFLPVLRGRYWFFTAYLVVMLVSPALNVLISNLSRRQFRLVFAALFVIFGVVPVGALGNDVLRISQGHHFSWMIVLYLIGGYLNVHGETVSWGKEKGFWLRGYFLLAGLHLVYKAGVRAVGLAAYGDLMLTYPSVLVLGEALCLFLFFRNACSGAASEGLAARLMGFVSPGVYSVYVIHVHPLIFWNSRIIGWFRGWDGWQTGIVVAALFVTAIAVFSACILLDAARRKLFALLQIDKIVEKLSDRMEAYVRTVLG